MSTVSHTQSFLRKLLLFKLHWDLSTQPVGGALVQAKLLMSMASLQRVSAGVLTKLILEDKDKCDGQCLKLWLEFLRTSLLLCKRSQSRGKIHAVLQSMTES